MEIIYQLLIPWALHWLNPNFEILGMFQRLVVEHLPHCFPINGTRTEMKCYEQQQMRIKREEVFAENKWGEIKFIESSPPSSRKVDPYVHSLITLMLLGVNCPPSYCPNPPDCLKGSSVDSSPLPGIWSVSLGVLLLSFILPPLSCSSQGPGPGHGIRLLKRKIVNSIGRANAVIVGIHPVLRTLFLSLLFQWGHSRLCRPFSLYTQ